MAKLVEIKTESTGLYYVQVAYFEGAASAAELLAAKAKAKATDNPHGAKGLTNNTISTPKMRPNQFSKQGNLERWFLGYAVDEKE
jgi:hypothetical protein